MIELATIGAWFKRVIIFAGVFLLLATVALYLTAAALIEALLMSVVEPLGGDLQLASVEASWSGLEVNIESYEEPALLVSGASLFFEWSDLLELSGRISGKVNVAFVVMNLPEKDEDFKALAKDVSAQMEILATRLHLLPVNFLEVNIEQLTLKSTSQSIGMHLVSNMLLGPRGERHLSVEVEGDFFTATLRAKLSDSGRHLGVDFIATATDWELFRASFLSEVFEDTSSNQLDVFIAPIAEDIGFLELSGYLRWNQQEPKQCGLTVLADLGAVEIHTPKGEAHLGKTACGFTLDGAGRMRTFGKGMIESVRLGSWEESAGSWELKLNDTHAAAEIRLSDRIELSLGHEDWGQLLSGAGTGRFFIETKETDFGLLYALEILDLPPDLKGSFGAMAEGTYSLEESKLAAAKLQVDLDINQVDLADKGVTVAKADAQASIELLNDGVSVGELTLFVGSIDVHGLALSELAVKAASRSSGELSIEGLSARLWGGKLRVGRLKFDRSDAAVVPIRIELNSVDMQQLAGSVSQFEGDAEGRLSGHLLCEWVNGSLCLKDGLLQIDEETEARLSYALDGLFNQDSITDSVTYAHSRMAEVAFQDMLLKRFQVELLPVSESKRPLRIELYGEYTREGVLIPVNYTLNMSADDALSLEHLLQMILSGELELN